MAAPTSPYVPFRVSADDGSGDLIITVTFTGAWNGSNAFTSARVQNTSGMIATALVRTPAGALVQGQIPAGFDHTFTQGQLGGWKQGDASSVENVSWR